MNTQKSKNRILPMLLALTMLLCLFPLTTAAAVGDYNPGDIAVINAIIENNGLDWPPCPYTDGDLSPAPTWMSSNWWRVEWSKDATDKRIVYLNINNLNLTGALNLSGLTGLESLYCRFNDLTELDLTDLTSLRELYCGGSNLTALHVSGLSNLEGLDCQDNKLTALDLSGLTNLRGL